MSPRISSSASGAPGTNWVGPPSSWPPLVPPARIGTRLVSPNIFSSWPNAGAENPALDSGTEAVIVWSSTARRRRPGGAAGRRHPPPVGARRRHRLHGLERAGRALHRLASAPRFALALHV